VAPARSDRQVSRQCHHDCWKPEKVEICRKLGADLALNYKTDDLMPALRNSRPTVSTSGGIIARNQLRTNNPVARDARTKIVMAGREQNPFSLSEHFTPKTAPCCLAMFNATAEEHQAAAATFQNGRPRKN